MSGLLLESSGNITHRQKWNIEGTGGRLPQELFLMGFNQHFCAHEEFAFGSGCNCRREFAEWLLAIGSGEFQASGIDSVEVKFVQYFPSPNVQVHRRRVVEFVYHDIRSRCCMASDMDFTEYFRDRAIITPLNDDVGELNRLIVGLIAGSSYISTLIDVVAEDDNSQAVPKEILHSFNPPGFPEHLLALKKNIPCMLLRNLATAKGLCNGTRLLINDFKPHVSSCTILTEV